MTSTILCELCDSEIKISSLKSHSSSFSCFANRKERENINNETNVQCYYCMDIMTLKELKLHENFCEQKQKLKNVRLDFVCECCGKLLSSKQSKNNHVKKCVLKDIDEKSCKWCEFFTKYLNENIKNTNKTTTSHNKTCMRHIRFCFILLQNNIININDLKYKPFFNSLLILHEEHININNKPQHTKTIKSINNSIITNAGSINNSTINNTNGDIVNKTIIVNNNYINIIQPNNMDYILDSLSLNDDFMLKPHKLISKTLVPLTRDDIDTIDDILSDYPITMQEYIQYFIYNPNTKNLQLSNEKTLSKLAFEMIIYLYKKIIDKCYINLREPESLGIIFQSIDRDNNGQIFLQKNKKPTWSTRSVSEITIKLFENISKLILCSYYFLRTKRALNDNYDNSIILHRAITYINEHYDSNNKIIITKDDNSKNLELFMMSRDIINKYLIDGIYSSHHLAEFLKNISDKNMKKKNILIKYDDGILDEPKKVKFQEQQTSTKLLYTNLDIIMTCDGVRYCDHKLYCYKDTDNVFDFIRWYNPYKRKIVHNNFDKLYKIREKWWNEKNYDVEKMTNLCDIIENSKSSKKRA